MLLVGAGLYLWLQAAPGAVSATVERDGAPLFTQDLRALSGPVQKDFPGADGHTVVIEFSPQGARFVSSTCPDKTCVRTGALRHAGETALCLPARIALRLEGDQGFDAATY